MYSVWLQILDELDKVKYLMPKLVRSASEPCVNISQSHFDELDFYCSHAPKTPVHPPLGIVIDAFASQPNTLKVL